MTALWVVNLFCMGGIRFTSKGETGPLQKTIGYFRVAGPVNRGVRALTGIFGVKRWLGGNLMLGENIGAFTHLAI